jgi:hypothetical protein
MEAKALHRVKGEGSGTPAAARIVHMPRLDSVLMVEDAIKGLDYYPTKNKLWRALPKAMMWQTFNVILDYLQKSGKIILDRKGEVVWIFADNGKAMTLMEKSVPYRRR